MKASYVGGHGWNPDSYLRWIHAEEDDDIIVVLANQYAVNKREC